MKWIFLFVLAFSNIVGRAQNKNRVLVKGHVFDSQSKTDLHGASIACLYSKDSSKASIAFSDVKGGFKLDSLDVGRYYLYITFMGYQSTLFPIILNDKEPVLDLGEIALKKIGVILSEVDIVGKKSPIRVSRDTIEFNAGSYKLNEHSQLEELLRRLPGIQVDADGTIRVNGEVVKTILVDGRPFFIDDPKIATKNLQADMVDKIQLIDRKIKERDPAIFDGDQTEKALNITIKGNRKKLWSGDLMSGYGSNKRFAIKANISRFSDDEQLAFIMNGDNINGLVDGVGSTNGVLERWNPNFTYTKDINNKMTFSFSYILQSVKNMDERSSIQKYFVGDTNYYYNQYSIQRNNRTSHGLITTLNYKINPTVSLLYTSNFGYYSGDDILMNNHGSYGHRQQLIDSGWIYNTMGKSGYSISNSVNIEKRFRRDGNSLNIQISYTLFSSKEKNYNLSNTLYNLSDGKYSLDTLNQHNTLDNSSSNLQFMITHSSSIFKKNTLVLSYGLVQSTNPYDKFTYDYNISEKLYNLPVDSLIGRFKNKVMNNFARLGIQTKGEKFDYNLSVFAMLLNLNSNNLLLSEQYRFNNIIVIPRGNFNYNFSNNRRIRFSLSGNPIVPTFDQLRPIVDNANPLLIRKGNPYLRAGSTYGVALAYSSFNASSLRFFTLSLNGGFFRNQIVNSLWLDSLKRQVVSPINVNGAYYLKINMDNSFSINRRNSSINMSTAVDLGRDMSYMNDVEGVSNRLAFSQTITYFFTFGEIANIYAGGNGTFNHVTYTGQVYGAADYFNFSLSIAGSMKVPLGISLGYNLSYSAYTGREESFNRRGVIFNGYISKILFPNHQGLVKLQGFDILNQNLSVVRNINPNYIEDVKMNTLDRFLMLSFTYFFKQSGKGR